MSIVDNAVYRGGQRIASPATLEETYRLLARLRTREDVEGFIAAVAGEPHDEVLARFAPAGQFSSAAPEAVSA